MIRIIFYDEITLTGVSKYANKWSLRARLGRREVLRDELHVSSVYEEAAPEAAGSATLFAASHAEDKHNYMNMDMNEYNIIVWKLWSRGALCGTWRITASATGGDRFWHCSWVLAIAAAMPRVPLDITQTVREPSNMILHELSHTLA